MHFYPHAHAHAHALNKFIQIDIENNKIGHLIACYYYYFSVHWIPPECYYDFKLAKTIPSADVWAFGTTLWEIFSFGATPDMGNDKDVRV